MAALVVSFPLCSICKKVVDLKTSKTDEDGYAIHEECYVPKLVDASRAKPFLDSR